MDIVTITAAIRAGTAATEYATRALEAFNSGDEQAAKDYLTKSRAAYKETREDWDNT